MRDYLKADEKNQLMIIQMFIQSADGVRRMENHPQISTMAQEWDKRGIILPEERKHLKTAISFLRKFSDSVMGRMSPKERDVMEKKLSRYDFRIMDAYTLDMLNRDINNKIVNAVVPREEFLDWSCEIMQCKCQGCEKDWNNCRLYEVFEDNLISESSWGRDNCRYSYGEKV